MHSPMYDTIDNCYCCGSDKFIPYLHMGYMPLANGYHREEEEVPSLPLKIQQCRRCYHSQIGIVVKPEVLFRNYYYVSGTSQTFQDHCRKLAHDTKSRLSIKFPSVLDIACNDGTLLESFQYYGCSVTGIDPAENLRKVTEAKDIPVHVDYWNEGVANRIGDKFDIINKFDIITATNVFAHVDNPFVFLSECKQAIHEHGMIIIEFPYAAKMFQDCEFDTIYHEHLSYFLVNSFATLVDRVEGLRIQDVVQTPIHGGSIRFVLRKSNIQSHHNGIIHDLIRQEYNNNLFKTSTMVDFGSQAYENRAKFLLAMLQLRKEKKKIIGYGASAKGNTALNFFNVDHTQVSYIVDETPQKQGLLTPGSNIPIVAPDVLEHEEEELYVIMSAWNFKEEILYKIQQLVRVPFHPIFYVPEVTIDGHSVS